MNVDSRLSRAGHAMRTVPVDVPPLASITPARPSPIVNTLLVALPAALLAVVVGLLAHATLGSVRATPDDPIAATTEHGEIVAWPSATEELELIRSLGLGKTEIVAWPSATEELELIRSLGLGKTEIVAWPSATDELRMIGSLAASRSAATTTGLGPGDDTPLNAA